MNLTRDTHIVTTRTFTGIITAAEIRKAFGLPDNARVTFGVPGGGDWSNATLDIDTYPIDVAWTIVEESKGAVDAFADGA